VLATTGADVALALAFAGLLVTAGAVLWLLASRRRRDHEAMTR